MKNLKTISLATIGTLAIIGTSVFASTGIVNAPSGLVLREEASKTSNPITTVPDKTEVNIVEEQDEWYKVTYSNHEGYLFGEYVEVEEQETVADSQENINQEGTTVKSKLKVYAIPLITSTVINEIEVESQITVEKQITNWSYIVSGEISGWVRTYALENKSETKVEEPQEEQNTETNTKQELVDQEPEVNIDENEEPTSEPSNTEQTEQSVSKTKGYVAVDYANVRKESSTNSEIVTTLTKDTSFEINAETQEWYKIKYTSPDDEVYEGYIFKELVTK